MGKLFNRFENKYIVKIDYLNNICNYLNNLFYFNDLWLQYYSIYFDTIDLKCLKDYINNKDYRQKIRIREYQNHNKFIEIKTKQLGKTKKKRIEITNEDINDIFHKHNEWISIHFDYESNSLIKTLITSYERITYENKDIRITIDKNIKFENLINDNIKEINDYIIIEVKKKEDILIDFEKYLINEYHINKEKFSKYFYGMN